MRKVLVDTNAFARLLLGDEKVFHSIAKADCVYMSVFVLGELYAGFKAGKREKANRHLLEDFLQKTTVQVLTATHDTAEVFGLIKDSLRKSGKPIPINDVWISAHALETGAILISYDKHFLSIPGLRIWEELILPQ